MKRLVLLILILFSFNISFAQVKEQLSEKEKARREKNIQAGNPFKRFGYKPKIATLSKGKYLEFHDLDTIMRIGSFVFNTRQKKITGYVNLDTVHSEATLNPQLISRWFSPDPLSEEYPSWSPYNFTMNNPIKFIDPDGRSVTPPDDFVFDENGDFVRIDENDKPDRLVIENSQTGSKQYYSFADPKEDPQQIRDHIIDKVVFVSKAEIEDMISKQGAFDPDNKDSWINFYKKSKGGQPFDYSYSVIPSRYGSEGASSNPLKKPSSLLFLPEGDYMAHNHMNFGNYLWAATGYTLGFNYSTLQLAAHGNSLFNSTSNGYPSQLDSKDDQISIIKGAYYAHKNRFRDILQRNINVQKNSR